MKVKPVTSLLHLSAFNYRNSFIYYLYIITIVICVYHLLSIIKSTGWYRIDKKLYFEALTLIQTFSI